MHSDCRIQRRQMANFIAHEIVCCRVSTIYQLQICAMKSDCLVISRWTVSQTIQNAFHARDIIKGHRTCNDSIDGMFTGIEKIVIVALFSSRSMQMAFALFARTLTAI